MGVTYIGSGSGVFGPAGGGTTNVVPRWTAGFTLGDTSPAVTSNGTDLLLASGAFRPSANDGAALGTATVSWSDLFLASGAVINFVNGDVTITHASNTLTFAGATSGYQFGNVVAPSTDDGAPLGSTTLNWSDLFLATGAVINYNNGAETITHATNTLTFAGFSGGINFGTENLIWSGNTTLYRSSGGGVSLQAPAAGTDAILFSMVPGSTEFTHTTGASSFLSGVASFTAGSGSGSFAGLHLNPIINGTSTGTAYGLVLGSRTNTLTGGTIKLMSLGTTTTDGFTGYTPFVDVIYDSTGSYLQQAMGTGTGFAKIVGVSNVNTTAVGNVGTGTDDLMTYALPANSMSANGKGIRITAWGTAANNANAKTVTVVFGGTTLLSTALTASQVDVWWAEAVVIRTSATAQEAFAELTQGGTVTLSDVEQSTPAETLSGAVTIKCTGTATSDNDIVQEGMVIEFLN